MTPNRRTVGAAVLAVALVAAGVAVGLPVVESNASAATTQETTTEFTYPAKFLCGSIDDGGASNLQSASEEAPVKPGNYATTINVFNPTSTEVILQFRASVGVGGGLEGALSPIQELVVEPGRTVSLTCPEIAGLFDGGEDAQFLDGFITIGGSELVRVSAVYTSKTVEERTVTENRTVNRTEQVRVNLNTGYDQDADALIPRRTGDDDWVVTDDPDRSTPYDAVVTDGNVIGFNPTLNRTRWLSTDANGRTNVSPGESFRYTYQFGLPANATNLELAVQLKSDDEADVFLNGNFIGNDTSGPSDPSFVTATSGFQPGQQNTVTVVVHDRGGIVTGFDLRGNVTGTRTVQETVTEVTDRSVGTGTSVDVVRIEPNPINETQ